MRRLVWPVAVVITVGLLAVGCGSRTDSQVDREAERAKLVEAINAFYRAIDSNDKAARASMFTDSAMMLPDGWPMRRGIETIRPIVLSGGDSLVFALKDREQVEMAFSGDIAYTVNQYCWSWHHRDSTPVWHKTKNIHIWRRQPDGAWKLHADIWNGSE